MFSVVLVCIQLAVTVIMGVYFLRQLRKEKAAEPVCRRESPREMEKLRQMRAVSLSEPLAERVRPATFTDIVGQEEGIRSLMAILSGANPQHVLIYGPPGVGKTCAARLVLEAAKKSAGTPFKPDAPFIEVDATCMRFDERAIADPLIGSVHDPIYQGAGNLGAQGVPQPKPGAVTKAHGGVLFLDEIGELHPTQMNKLLKVLEDRRVMLESAYYDPEDGSVPRHIHDIFERGLPADFRLVGATTRSPGDISPALRSRCMEVFFRPLTPEEVASIAAGAAERAGYAILAEDAATIGRYASCGREAVNIVQMCAGLAQMEGRSDITPEDVSWVVTSGHYPARPSQRADTVSRVGFVHGLAVSGSTGAVMDIEAVVTAGTGQVHVTGIVDEEELGQEGHRMRRKSTARGSAENVRTLLAAMGFRLDGRDVHINFPGGAPVDGPSAGAAMALVAISALTDTSIDGSSALTGEITVHGAIKAVGGVPDKVAAAKAAGLKRVFIPKENDAETLHTEGIEVICVSTLTEVIAAMLLPQRADAEEANVVTPSISAAAQGDSGQSLTTAQAEGQSVI